jgi:hypothetical protein
MLHNSLNVSKMPRRYGEFYLVASDFGSFFSATRSNKLLVQRRHGKEIVCR